MGRKCRPKTPRWGPVEKKLSRGGQAEGCNPRLFRGERFRFRIHAYPLTTPPPHLSPPRPCTCHRRLLSFALSLLFIKHHDPSASPSPVGFRPSEGKVTTALFHPFNHSSKKEDHDATRRPRHGTSAGNPPRGGPGSCFQTGHLQRQSALLHGRWIRNLLRDDQDHHVVRSQRRHPGSQS